MRVGRQEFQGVLHRAGCDPDAVGGDRRARRRLAEYGERMSPLVKRVRP